MIQEKIGSSIWRGWGRKEASQAALPWCVVWLGIFLLFFLQRLLVLFHHVPLDYNEGWGASLSGWALGGTHSLYSSSDGFVFNNYPPVFFVILGSISRLTGLDTIIVGRIISCLSVLAVSWLINCIVWSMTGRRFAALAAGSIFLATSCTAFYDYFGMSDPQWLAQATMLAALALVIKRGIRDISFARLCLAALLVILAGFIKHNLIAMPLALTVWLFCNDRRKGCFFAVMVLLLALVAFALCDAIYGWNFFHDIFLHKRVIRLSRFAHGLRILPMMGGILAVAIGGVCYLRNYDSPLPLFLVLGLILGEMESLGKGVDYNCMFDAFVAGSILCGIFLGNFREKSLVTLGCLVMSLPLLVLVPWREENVYKELVGLRDQDSSWQENIEFLKPYDRSLLCVDMTMAHWTGVGDAVDLFNLGQALKKGEDRFLLRSEIMQHKFSFIQLYGNKNHYGSGVEGFDTWVREAGYRILAESGHGVVVVKAP